MALPRFFCQVSRSIGGHLEVSSEQLDSLLADAAVVIHGGALAGVAGTSENIILELLLRILGRLYPHIEVVGEAAAFGEALLREINPRVEGGSPAQTTCRHIVVGRVDEPPAGAIHTWASGWVATVSPDLKCTDEAVPAVAFASAAAACLTAGQLFLEAVAGGAPLATRRDVSLLDFRGGGCDRGMPDVDLGAVALIGVGAVGNAAAWTLSKAAGIGGTLHLVDHEEVDLSNLQRYVLPGDADVGASKVELAARALSTSGLQAVPHPQTLDEFVDAHPTFPFPSAVVAVDNIEGRRQTQAMLPRLVVNGWTSDSGLGASWHRFGDDAPCLACLYHPTGGRPSQTELVASALGLTHERTRELWIKEDQTLTRADLETIASTLGTDWKQLAEWRGRALQEFYSDAICGSSVIDWGDAKPQVVVPLAHQSVMAGVLAAAELVKQSSPELRALSQPQRCLIWDDVLRGVPGTWVQPRARVAGCICCDPDYQEAYAAKWPTQAGP